MRRREFIALLGGAAAWPLAARAQPSERMRRIGALMNLAADDSESQLRVVAFAQGLSELGWSVGRNLHIDFRWAVAEVDRFRSYAAELVALAPDVILASASPAVAALQQATRSVPLVFVTVVDPVGAGIVPNLARPGGNTTGFTLFEYAISGKWLEPTQGGCARRDARRGITGFRLARRYRPIRRHPNPRHRRSGSRLSRLADTTHPRSSVA